MCFSSTSRRRRRHHFCSANKCIKDIKKSNSENILDIVHIMMPCQLWIMKEGSIYCTFSTPSLLPLPPLLRSLRWKMYLKVMSFSRRDTFIIILCCQFFMTRCKHLSLSLSKVLSFLFASLAFPWWWLWGIFQPSSALSFLRLIAWCFWGKLLRCNIVNLKFINNRHNVDISLVAAIFTSICDLLCRLSIYLCAHIFI